MLIYNKYDNYMHYSLLEYFKFEGSGNENRIWKSGVEF